MDLRRIDAGVHMGDHIWQPDSIDQGAGRFSGDHSMRRQFFESSTRSRCRRPSLVRNQMACNIEASLDSQKKVEGDEVESVTVGDEATRAVRTVT